MNIYSNGFLKISFAALAGIMALSAPKAVSGSIAASVDRYYDDLGVYDLKLTSKLGFTDEDIEILSGSDRIERVDTEFVLHPEEEAKEADGEPAIDYVGTYNTLYVWVAGAGERISVTDEYRSLINSAREYIELYVEPKRLEKRRADIKAEREARIEELNRRIEDEVVSLREEAEADQTDFDEDYERAKAGFKEEQESINKAKKAIQESERNAQSLVEGEKDELRKVLDEVYSKSVVTAADLKRAQGISSLVSGSESSYHEKFTDQWAELSELEIKLHDQETALDEEKEKHDKENAARLKQAEDLEKELNEEILALQKEGEVDTGRWSMEDRSRLDGYSQCVSIMDITDRILTPTGILIYVLSLIAETAAVFGMIRRNKYNIEEGLRQGLDETRTKAHFVKVSTAASALGSLIGMAIGLIVIPVAASYAYADQFVIEGIVLDPKPLWGAVGAAVMVLTALVSSNVSYNRQITK